MNDLLALRCSPVIPVASTLSRALPGHFVQPEATVSTPRAPSVSGQGAMLHVWGVPACPGGVPRWACAHVRSGAARPCPGGGGYRYPIAARTRASG
jgi:hypothetical protein